MWLIIYIAAVIVPLIIWGFVAGRREEKHNEQKAA